MVKAFRILCVILAVEVVIQASAIAYALSGLGKYIDDGHTVDKAFVEAVMDGDKSFTGAGGFALHGMNGTMIIPLLAIVTLIVSFFAKVPGAVRAGGILFGMVALQIILGMSSHSAPFLAPLHAINGFGIFAMAVTTARTLGGTPYGSEKGLAPSDTTTVI